MGPAVRADPRLRLGQRVRAFLLAVIGDVPLLLERSGRLGRQCGSECVAKGTSGGAIDLTKVSTLESKVTTLGNKNWLAARGVADVVELDWWQSHKARAGLGITCTPAQHFAARAPWDRCRTLWGGFMLRAATGRIFFAGDTGWAPHFAEIKTRLGAPALALLPIGAYEPRWFMEPVHMNPDEAVRAHLALGARQSIGMHFGTFQLTNEDIAEPLAALAVARAAHGVEPAAFTTLDFGETRLFDLP